MYRALSVLKELIAVKDVTDVTTIINKTEQRKGMQQDQKRTNHFCWTKHCLS